MKLILASASPRRAELLTAAGFDFEVMTVEVDERPRARERPEDYVRRLAREKSARAMEKITAADTIVIGADTSVVIDGDILGKPRDVNAARAMLKRLSGRSHEVMTGISLRKRSSSPGHVELGLVEKTAVYFAPLGDQDIEWYVQSGEGFDKAGSYAIQGLGTRFVQRIEGSYSNVVGLPMAAVHELLRQITAGCI
jgi:septum formation protein